MKHIPVLIVIIPLCAALLSLLLTKINEKLGKVVVVGSLVLSLIFSVIQFVQVAKNGPILYALGGYEMPLGIGFSIDSVNAIIIVLIALFGVMSMMFSDGFGYKDKIFKGGGNALIALLVVGMLGMTSTGDVFNLYVFLEITSLSAYCLIALGGDKGVVAAFRYMLIGTVAASFYLMGVGILYSNTGTLNMADMEILLNGGRFDNAMLIAFCFIVAAFGIKMALFPFHGWQSSAYSYSQPGATPLIAGVMGKIPAYAMFRYLYCVFGTDFSFFKPILVIIGILSVGSMLYGSIRAMGQTDIRKILAYSSVAQIGYISLGFAIGTPIALAGAFVHLLGHAFMKGGLFFAAGAIKYKYGTVDFKDFGRIYKKMPLTCGLLVVAALSMIGIPPTAGFFSKWYLGVGAAGTGQWIYLAVLVISSLLNAVYFFRLIEKVFIQNKSNKTAKIDDKAAEKLAKSGAVKSGLELPWNLIVPIVVCFVMILGIGLFNAKIVNILLVTLKGVGL